MPRTVPKGYKQANYMMPESLHNRAVSRASKEGRNVSDLVVDAIKAYLSSAKAPRAKKG